MITKDRIADEYKTRFKQSGCKPKVYSLSAFESYAAVGSDTEWARYGFSYLTVQIDKLNGTIQKLVNDKASLSSEVAERLIDRSAGAFINSVYRSIKNHRDGRAAPSWLDAMETIPAFLTRAFACAIPFCDYGHEAFACEHTQGDEFAVHAPIRVFLNGLHRYAIWPKVMNRRLFLAFLELVVYP